MTILGAILAGGEARRFGADKALAELGGIALIDHAIAALGSHVDAVVVIGRGHPDIASAPDLPGPGLGPLGGIAGALAYAEAHGFASVLTAPCDVPSPPPALFAELRGPPCWCADHPVFGHWPAAFAVPLRDWLASGNRRAVREWASAMGAVAVSVPFPIDDIDTPADLARLS